MEVLHDGRVTRASDVYSFGMIMLEVFTGVPVFEGYSSSQVQALPCCSQAKCWHCHGIVIPAGGPLLVDVVKSGSSQKALPAWTVRTVLAGSSDPAFRNREFTAAQQPVLSLITRLAAPAR